MNTSRNILKGLFSLLLVGFICAQGFAQQARQAIVLIEGKPTRVLMTEEGTIKKILGEEPDYMEDFEIQKVDLENFALESEVSDEFGHILEELSDEIDFITQQYATIVFGENQALLGKEALYTLDAIVNYLKENTSQNIIIYVNRSNVGEKSIKLASNRSNGCKRYLYTKGIALERVIIKTKLVSPQDPRANVLTVAMN